MSEEDITDYIEGYTPLIPEQIAERQEQAARSQQIWQEREQRLQAQRDKTGGECKTELGAGSLACTVSFEHYPNDVDVCIDDTEDVVLLSPSQALALHAWISEHKALLEQVRNEEHEQSTGE